MIEVYAIAVGVEGGSGVGSISHNVEIVTESDHLYLPVKATVLTAFDYDRTPEARESSGVKLVNSKPPGSEGIIRPRKEALLG